MILRKFLRQKEREYLVDLLVKMKGNVLRACDEAGVHSNQMYLMMHRNNILIKDRPKFGLAEAKPEGFTIIWRDRAAKRPRKTNK